MSAAAFRAIDLLVVVGPSGAGKSTLIKRLMKEFPACFGYSVSHTTRAPRAGEVDGISYHFVAPDAFKAIIDEGRFLEHATVHNTSYGTSEMSVNNVLATNQVVCMDLDIKGAQRLRLNRRFKSLIVFVETPSHDVLERRLRERATETEEKLQVRLTNAKKEVTWYKNNSAFFDAHVVNDELDACYAEFRAAVVGACFPNGFEAPAAMPTHARQAAACRQMEAVTAPPDRSLPKRVSIGDDHSCLRSVHSRTRAPTVLPSQR